ncbi:hypothetical protein H0A66_12625 [Alcaligenaceae bacterium]|nr:hypothetical protein [Alcaligenaceae bacterium]
MNALTDIVFDLACTVSFYLVIIMNALTNVISSVDFWKLVLPLFGAVVAWYMNESRKRLLEQYQRKEANYKELVRTLRGFYEGAENQGMMRTEFLNQLNVAWLYCPDDVIKKGYVFLETVHANAIQDDDAKEDAMGAFVLAIRKDLLSRKLVQKTGLIPSDFKHLNGK